MEGCDLLDLPIVGGDVIDEDGLWMMDEDGRW